MMKLMAMLNQANQVARLGKKRVKGAELVWPRQKMWTALLITCVNCVTAPTQKGDIKENTAAGHLSSYQVVLWTDVQHRTKPHKHAPNMTQKLLHTDKFKQKHGGQLWHCCIHQLSWFMQYTQHLPWRKLLYIIRKHWICLIFQRIQDKWDNMWLCIKKKKKKMLIHEVESTWKIIWEMLLEHHKYLASGMKGRNNDLWGWGLLWCIKTLVRER